MRRMTRDQGHVALPAGGRQAAGPAAAAAAPEEAACSLPGGAAASFHHRCNLRQAQMGHLADYVILVLCLSGLRRCWGVIFGSPWPLKALLVTWQAAVILGCTGNIVWSRRWHQSYARWREAPAAALRMATFGMGLGGVLMRGLMDAAPLPLPAGAAAAALPGSSAGLEGSVGGMLGVGTHLLRLLFISGTVHLLLLAMAWRVRLSLSILVQLAMAASLSSAQQLCGAGLLAHPATQRATHEVYQLLSTLAYTLPLPVSAFLSPEPVTQCATVLRWFQIALGLLAPLLWEAAWAARLFQQHQRQRRAQGLAPERGAHAALYGAVWSVTREGSGVPVGAIAWLLLAVSWDWCAFFSVPAAQRRWEGGAVAATMAAGT